MSHSKQQRILLVDDSPAIHEDFMKILGEQNNSQLFNDTKAALFGTSTINNEKTDEKITFTIDSAFQGQEALELVRKAIAGGNPYSLAFVDIRMPPGWDGIATTKHLWEVDPHLQVVICTAYSDYSWSDISQELKNSDNFLILKKPFDIAEIQQLVAALTTKWELRRQVANQVERLKTLTTALEKSLSLTKATLEATQEGILVINNDKKVTNYNKVFLDLWNISESLLKIETIKNIFPQLAEQVEDSNSFLTMMTNLCEYPKAGNMKEWKIKSGKTFELYSHPQYLRDEIVGNVFSFLDITERKHLEDQLLHQATHDGLTGLPNRVLLTDRIRQAIAYARRQKSQLAILLFDLDNFKQVNDSLGHNAGDTLLKLVSNKLKGFIRESDTVARLGGDEFVVILSFQNQQEDLSSAIQRLQELFSTPCEIEDHKITVTTSIGISLYPKDGADPNALLKNADAALYRAKEMGRNTSQFYLSEFNEHILQRAELITSLHQALNNNEFILHYQPLLQLNSSKIIGVEALLRWEHPSLGTLQPTLFIPLAEETGLIVPIGEWVLRTACLQNKVWQKSVNPELCMAVNISAYQFRQKNFVELVRKILVETEMEAKFLELEITESLILGNDPEVLKKMMALKELGIRLSIDDFGTGYASLSYLKYFPFDKLKIDKSFIDGINSQSEDTSIIEAIINLTKVMGIEVLAEGVEKSEQVEFLSNCQSDQVQGFYFSPPVNAEKLTSLLQKKEISKDISSKPDNTENM